MLKMLNDYGVTIVFFIFMLKWIIGTLKAKNRDDKTKLDMIIEQNRQFMEFFIKDSNGRTDRFESALNSIERVISKLADEREITDSQFKPIILVVTRLLKNRICERINNIINRNNLLTNKEEIMQDIDIIFNSEIGFIEADLSEIHYGKKSDLYNIYYDNKDYYISLVKYAFAELEECDLADREGYNKVSRRAINFVEEFVTEVRGDIETYFKK